MELKNGRVQISYDRDNNSLELRVINRDASLIPFVEITLTNDQFCQMLSGVALVECESMKVNNLELVGKKQIVDTLDFKMPENNSYDKEVAKILAKKICPEGWKPDLHFSSQNFFKVDGIPYARTYIRKWIKQ